MTTPTMRDRRVLAVEIGARALLHGGGDLPHAVGAGGRRHDRARRDDAVEQRQHAADDDQPMPIVTFVPRLVEKRTLCDADV